MVETVDSVGKRPLGLVSDAATGARTIDQKKGGNVVRAQMTVGRESGWGSRVAAPTGAFARNGALHNSAISDRRPGLNIGISLLRVPVEANPFLLGVFQRMLELIRGMQPVNGPGER